MNIERTKKEAVVVEKVAVEDLAGGTVFKIGKKLYLKLADSPEAVRLTTGEVQIFDYDDEADEIVTGTFNYA